MQMQYTQNLNPGRAELGTTIELANLVLLALCYSDSLSDMQIVILVVFCSYSMPGWLVILKRNNSFKKSLMYGNDNLF